METQKNLFPHSNFPFRLEYTDGNDKKICWFESQSHLDKHITRYNLDGKKLKIDCKNQQLTVAKTEKEKAQKKTPKKSTKPADSSGKVSTSRKRKT